MLISSPRIPTPISATTSIIAFAYGIIMVFVLHRHEEYWALVVGLSFAIYPLVPKLPQGPVVPVFPELGREMVHRH
jgi:hypothetical protein